MSGLRAISDASFMQVARREVVGAVDDHVVVGDQVEHVVLVHPERVDVDLHVGVERLDRDPRRLALVHAHAVGGVDDLALEVARVHHVVVDQADACPPRRRPGRGPPATPRPPAPMRSALQSSSLSWPCSPTSGMSVWRL